MAGRGRVKYPLIERNTGPRSLPPALPTHKPQAWNVPLRSSFASAAYFRTEAHIHTCTYFYLYQQHVGVISVYVYVDKHHGHTGVCTLIPSLHCSLPLLQRFCLFVCCVSKSLLLTFYAGHLRRWVCRGPKTAGFGSRHPPPGTQNGLFWVPWKPSADDGRIML